MAEFTNLQLTKDGEEYLGRALVEPINFTEAIIKLSTQVVDPIDIPTLTALNTVSDIFPITQAHLNKSTNTLVISARFNNLDIKSDIAINTIGLFVYSNGTEKLIAATTATVPLVVRKFNKTANFYNLKLSLNISSDSNTPITITDGNFASIDDINRLESDKQNKLKPGRNILINNDGTIETVFQEITDIAQLKGEKGDKGEPFLYKDFTQAQLDALKGPKGDGSVEVEQARVDVSGHINPTLKERLDKEHSEVITQLAQKVGDGKKAELEDLSSTVLSAIEGGEGTNFELLSVPQPKSVTPRTISSTLLEDFDKSNVVKINQQSAHSDYTRTEIVFDIMGLGLANGSPITVQFDIYSDNPLINTIGSRLYLNNNPDDLTSATAYSDLHYQPYVQSQIKRYQVTRDSYVSGNRFVHLFVDLGSGVGKVPIEYYLSNIQIKIDGQKLKNAETYKGYNSTDFNFVKVSGLPNRIVSSKEFKEFKELIETPIETPSGQLKTYNKVGGEGDSNMYGRHADGVSKLSPTWLDMVANHFRATEIWNGGVSGCNISTSLHQGSPRSPLVNRLNNIPLDCDLFFAEGGFNDYWTNTPKGTMDSRDTGNFYGALHAYYGHLAENIPFADIVVIGVWQSRIGTEFGGSRSDGTTMRQWANIQREVAEYYGLPFCDSYADFISVNVQSHVDNFSTDRLHLTEAGRDKFAKRAIGFASSI